MALSIGVLRQAYERASADPEIVGLFMTAIEELRRAGATIVDPARSKDVAAIKRRAEGPVWGSNTISIGTWPRKAIACR